MDQLQQIGAQLGIDQSFYHVFGTVVVLYFVLSLVYLKPFQKLLDKRRGLIHGVKNDAQEMTTRAEAKYNEYKASLKTVTDQARGIMRAAEETAHKEEASLLGAASSKAKVSLQNVQAQLDTERKAVMDTIAGEISALASEVATKVLGRPVSGSATNGHRS